MSNALPAMYEALAERLGVSAESLAKIGFGWDLDKQCWVSPERDATGEIIGLVRRYRSGKKFSVTGSKRGLSYVMDPTHTPGLKTYAHGKQNWVRATAGAPCPICGKSDWCLISAENVTDPKAVLCGRVSAGARKDLGNAGYLHIRKPEGVVSHGLPLPLSTRPILIVEGASDVAAALDLGFVAVGKPSASGGLDLLSQLVAGRPVVVLGENDSGAGRVGMEKTFETVRTQVASVVKLMPPEGTKDLRAWVQQGLTESMLLEAIAHGDSASVGSLLESTNPLEIAELWLKSTRSTEGVITLRKFAGSWYEYDGHKYASIDQDSAIRGPLYSFLRDKTVREIGAKGDVNVRPYGPTQPKISHIIDALLMTCPVSATPPCWLDGREEPKPEDIICFKNGILDVDTWLGSTEAALMGATPHLFTLTSAPYDFNFSAKCPQWQTFLHSIFPDDPLKISLLQEWFGYNMVADTSQEKLMLFVGRPRSGKGTVLEVLRAVLGPNQVANTSFATLSGDFGLMPLVGKLAAFLPDAHVPKRADATHALELLKSVVGRDSIDINRKNKDFLTGYKPYCRFTIAVNELPALPDHARALEPRLCLLYFGETFEGREDRGLKARLPQEAPGIAVWALEGLRRLRRQGQFTAPPSSIPVLADFRCQMTPMAEFADDCCMLGAGMWVDKQKIYDLWIMWAKNQGIQSGTRAQFGQRLLALYPSCEAGRKTLGGQQIRGYRGMGLTPRAESILKGGA
ncbi:MAG: hypothetical protein IMZ50_12640 [Candidatus Atribacteria bacterium]|nr:hypothetical protein [Candidatus Atribacteria bacterium]